MYERRSVAPVCWFKEQERVSCSRENRQTAQRPDGVKLAGAGRGNSSASTNNAVVSSVPGPMPMTLYYRAGDALPCDFARHGYCQLERCKCKSHHEAAGVGSIGDSPHQRPSPAAGFVWLWQRAILAADVPADTRQRITRSNLSLAELVSWGGATRQSVLRMLKA